MIAINYFLITDLIDR